MAFEVFEKGSAPISSVPAVTIQKRGLFSLNDAAYKLMGEPRFVNFLWDAEQKLIALRPTDENDLNGYPARHTSSSKNAGPVLLAGSLFTRHIDLDTSQARRWTPTMREGNLVIDLKVEGALVVSNRGRRKETPPPNDPVADSHRPNAPQEGLDHNI